MNVLRDACNTASTNSNVAQVSGAVKETVASTAKMLAEQNRTAAMVGVGSAAILAAGVSSNMLVDNLCTQLGYPFDLVVPGGFQHAPSHSMYTQLCACLFV